MGEFSADECDHDDFDHDILTGRATCNMCDAVWYLSTSDIAFLSQCQADWDAYHATLDQPEPVLTEHKVSDDELPF